MAFVCPAISLPHTWNPGPCPRRAERRRHPWKGRKAPPAEHPPVLSAGGSLQLEAATGNRANASWRDPGEHRLHKPDRWAIAGDWARCWSAAAAAWIKTAEHLLSSKLHRAASRIPHPAARRPPLAPPLNITPKRPHLFRIYLGLGLQGLRQPPAERRGLLLSHRINRVCLACVCACPPAHLPPLGHAGPSIVNRASRGRYRSAAPASETTVCPVLRYDSDHLLGSSEREAEGDDDTDTCDVSPLLPTAPCCSRRLPMGAGRAP